jgi:hypothetical protein
MLFVCLHYFIYNGKLYFYLILNFVLTKDVNSIF